MTALLNDAYRTLRHPVRRVEYLLSLYGLKSDGSKVPQSLLMEVFEINEQLEEVKAGMASVEEADSLRAQIKEKRERFDAVRAPGALTASTHLASADRPVRSLILFDGRATADLARRRHRHRRFARRPKRQPDQTANR